MAVALGISGRIGSGKTSLAVMLSEQLGCSKASFGDYVRSVAVHRGLDANDRAVLQEVGDGLIATGWRSFCTAVLSSAGYSDGSVIVDGIRHLEAARTLRAILDPIPWYLIAVDTGQEARMTRLLADGIDHTHASQADAHHNEEEIEPVIRSADLIVSGEGTPTDVLEAVTRWLSTVPS
jgi:dephospho-CoA kinase